MVFMDLEDMRKRLELVLSDKRYRHSVNVMETAVKLAVKYGEDSSKAALAGLLHDCAREIRGEEIFEACRRYDIPVDMVTRAQPELLHGSIGAELAREEYAVWDESVLDAIRFHTTGRENMSMLEKIVFIADYIEPGRNFPEVHEARKIAFEDIDMAVLNSLDRTMGYLINRGVLIHTDTVNARNSVISLIKARGQTYEKDYRV